MSGDFPSLGFDPAPGDVPTAADVASGVAQTARALEEIAALLSSAADGAWRGQAANAFRDLLSDEFRPKVDAAARSFRGARRALDDWLDTMRTSQGRARSLESQHAGAVQRARAAHAALADSPEATPPADAARTAEEAAAESERLRARAAVSRSVSAADAEVDRIERAARNLLDEYEDLGRQAASRLQRAMDIAPNEPGFWERLAGGVGKALDELGEAAADVRDAMAEVFEKVAPLLRVIGDIAGALSAVLGLLAFVPFLQFLAVPTLALGFLALLADYGAAVGETGSFTEALTDGDVLMDAVGLVFGIGALAAGTRLVTAARTGSSTGVVGTSTTHGTRQAIGRKIETPTSFFQLARSASYSMGEQEFVWRLARNQANVGGLILMGAESKGYRATFDKLVAGNFGPLTQRPRAVR